jgi:hypothetical protein
MTSAGTDLLCMQAEMNEGGKQEITEIKKIYELQQI